VDESLNAVIICCKNIRELIAQSHCGLRVSLLKVGVRAGLSSGSAARHEDLLANITDRIFVHYFPHQSTTNGSPIARGL